MAVDLTDPALEQWIAQQLSNPENYWRSGEQGVLLRYRRTDVDLVIKCPWGNGARAWFNRRSIRHEYLVYQRLAGAPGITRCHGLVKGTYLVLDHIEAVPYREAVFCDRGQWFSQFFRVISALHERGVAHGDLKRKANILVTHSQQPLVVDFGAAVLRPKGFHPYRRQLFQYLAQVDLNAYLKHKYHGRYEDVAGSDLDLLRYSRLEQVISRWRKWREARRLRGD